MTSSGLILGGTLTTSNAAPSKSSSQSARKAGPEKVKLKAVGEKKTRVKWRNVAGASRYQVRLGKKIRSTNRTSITGKLRTGQKVRVRARIGSGWTTWSKPIRKLSTAAPKSVRVTAVGIYTGHVTWAPVKKAMRYRVNLGGSIHTTSKRSVRGWLEWGESVRVRAKTRQGWTAWSAPVYKGISKIERGLLLDERADLRIDISDYEAEIATDQAQLSTLEYQLGIAIKYNDTLRAAVIRAEMATLRARISRTQLDLDRAQARLATVDKMLAT